MAFEATKEKIAKKREAAKEYVGSFKPSREGEHYKVPVKTAVAAGMAAAAGAGYIAGKRKKKKEEEERTKTPSDDLYTTI